MYAAQQAGDIFGSEWRQYWFKLNESTHLSC
jgi:hypothetical protein